MYLNCEFLQYGNVYTYIHSSNERKRIVSNDIHIEKCLLNYCFSLIKCRIHSFAKINQSE